MYLLNPSKLVKWLFYLPFWLKVYSRTIMWGKQNCTLNLTNVGVICVTVCLLTATVGPSTKQLENHWSKLDRTQNVVCSIQNLLVVDPQTPPSKDI